MLNPSIIYLLCVAKLILKNSSLNIYEFSSNPTYPTTYVAITLNNSFIKYL